MKIVPKFYLPALERFLATLKLHGPNHRHTVLAEKRYEKILARYCQAVVAARQQPKAFMAWI